VDTKLEPRTASLVIWEGPDIGIGIQDVGVATSTRSTWKPILQRCHLGESSQRPPSSIVIHIAIKKQGCTHRTKEDAPGRPIEYCLLDVMFDVLSRRRVLVAHNGMRCDYLRQCAVAGASGSYYGFEAIALIYDCIHCVCEVRIADDQHSEMLYREYFSG